MAADCARAVSGQQHGGRGERGWGRLRSVRRQTATGGSCSRHCQPQKGQCPRALLPLAVAEALAITEPVGRPGLLCQVHGVLVSAGCSERCLRLGEGGSSAASSPVSFSPGHCLSPTASVLRPSLTPLWVLGGPRNLKSKVEAPQTWQTHRL